MALRKQQVQLGAVACAMVVCWPAWSKPPAIETRCDTVECFSGTKVISYATKGDPYFACPTAELSDYLAVVGGFMAMSYTLSGRFPNISPKTGEPEYEGKTAEIIKQYRIAAGVRTFDQAAALCRDGKHGQKLIVANNPKDGYSAWVAVDGKPTENFWVPKDHLNLRR